jgi:DNA-binding Lrp family transcriptional regulator
MLNLNNRALREAADRILARAVPPEQKADLERLLTNILLYLKRVQVGELADDERGYPQHRSLFFQGLTPSRPLAESLVERLRIVDEYRIESVKRIEEMLLYGLVRHTTPALTAEHLRLLQEVFAKPLAKTAKLSRHLRMSRPKVVRLLHQLQDQVGLVRGLLVNPSKFKLATCTVVFRTKSYNASERLEDWTRSSNPPFLKALVFDVDYRIGYLSFGIPAQQRALDCYERRIEWLHQQFMDRVHVHHATKLICNVRFDLYEQKAGQWRIPASLAEPDTLSSISHEVSDGERAQMQIEFGKSMRFSQIDYLLAESEAFGAAELASKCRFLEGFGFRLSPKTVWSRLQRLIASGALVPYAYLSGAGFEEFVCFSAHCDAPAQNVLLTVARQLPFTYTYLTEEGAALFMKKPAGWTDITNQLAHTISELPGVNDLMVVHQERNVGSNLSAELFRRWNEKRQFWVYEPDEI